MPAGLSKKILSKHGHSIDQLTIEAGSIKTYYLHAGQGKPVIFLHGAGGGSLVWLPLISSIAKEFEVFVPDIPGYGESDKPEASYDKAFFSKWLLHFFEARGIKKASIVANSMGGAVAMQFALDCPRRVEKLVLAGSCGFGLQGMSKRAFLSMMISNIFPTATTIKGLLRHLIFKENLMPGKEQINYFLKVIKSPGGKRAFSMGRGKAAAPFPDGVIKKIKQPVLLIWGNKDIIVPMINATKGEALLPNSKLKIIDETGHVPFVEKPGEFLRLALPFLRESTALSDNPNKAQN